MNEQSAAGRRPGPHFPPSVERALVASAIEGDDAAVDRLVETFQPLIGTVARLYAGVASVSRAELMQEGVVGLLRALERYDRSQGTPFWAYASWWVRRSMQGLVAELSRPVVLSDRALRQLARIRAARRDDALAGRRPPTARSLAESTGLAPEQVDSLTSVDRTPRALDAAAGEEPDGPPLVDMIADPAAEQAYERVERQITIETVRALCAELSERERTVVEARYGLGRPARTLRQVGDEVGVTAERVRQIEGAALDKLRVAASAAGV